MTIALQIYGLIQFCQNNSDPQLSVKELSRKHNKILRTGQYGTQAGEIRRPLHDGATVPLALAIDWFVDKG